MNYPLHLSFKILALARQLRLTDASGNRIFHVKQKVFKLKEAVTVFVDEGQTQPLYFMRADRVLDFSANYHFTDKAGAALGSVRRRGAKSLWRAQYDILDGSSLVMTIKEEKPWTKVLDGLLGEIPIVGMFTGYFLHPTYVVSRANGALVLRVTKQPAFLEGKFIIEKHAEMTANDEIRALLGLTMMVLLERDRG